MRIKIKRKFKAVLSLLVTVMLLVGVMPLSAVQVHAATFTVYFAKNMGTAKFSDVYIKSWGSGSLNGIAAMTYVENSRELYGYEIYKYDFTSKPNSFRFASDSTEVWKTVTVEGNDLQFGDIYYTTNTTDRFTVGHRPWSFLTLTSVDYSTLSDYTIFFDTAANGARSGANWYNFPWVYTSIDSQFHRMVPVSNAPNGSTTLFAYDFGNSAQSAFDSGAVVIFTNSREAWNTSGGDNYNYTDDGYTMYKRVYQLAKNQLSSGSNANRWYLCEYTLADRGDTMSAASVGSNSATTFPDGSNVTAKLYDYYSDYEMSKGEKRVYLSNNKDKYYNNDTDGYDWPRKCNPNVTFNQKLSDVYSAYHSQATHLSETFSPMYFGDFDVPDRYENNTIVTSWYGYNSTGNFAGTTADTGQGNKKNMYAKTLNANHRPVVGGTNALEVPFFDTSFLRSGTQKLGQVYGGITFPFYKDSNGFYSADCEEYVYRYNSSGISATQATSSNAVYGVKPTNGVQTAKGDFFPFDDRDDTNRPTSLGLARYADKMNYGFGMELQMDFMLVNANVGNDDNPVYTDSNNNDIRFSFEGDDDLVVYLDDYLLLDIGGTHVEVAGTINFNQAKVIDNATDIDDDASSGTAFSSYNTSIPASYYASNGKLKPGAYTLRVFYVERGLWESNFKMKYNFTMTEPRKVQVKESVGTGNVNQIFTSTFQTGDFASNNTGAANFNENIGKLTFDIGFQLKDVSNSGGWGNTHTSKWETSNFASNTFSVRQGTTNSYWGSYFDQYVKQNRYNLKFDETQVYIAGNSNKISASSLFECSWTYTSDYATDSGSGDGFSAPASSTGSGSRPMRRTKTTSTSPDNNSDFLELDGTEDNPNIMQFINTMQTGTLTITKTFNRKSGDEEVHEFSFTVTFNNVGGLNLEEPGGIQGATDNVIITTVSVSYTAGQSGEQTATIDNIPAGTQYTVVENDTPFEGYMTNYTADTGSMVQAGRNVGVANSPSGAPEKIILELIVELGSTDTLENANDLPAVKLSIQRRKGEENWSELTTVTVPKVANLSQSAQRTLERSLSYLVASVETDYMDKYDSDTVYEYQIIAYKSDGTTLITETETEYGDSNGFIVWYNASGVPAHIRNGTEATDDDSDASTPRVLEMGVKLTLPEQQQNTPETGGRGGYVPIAGGFIAILLAGAGYFIYKKRLFA